MFLVVQTPCITVGPVSDKNFGDVEGQLERLESPLPVLAWGVSAILGIRLGLHWKLRTLDKPLGFLVLKPPGVRFAEVLIPKLLS